MRNCLGLLATKLVLAWVNFLFSEQDSAPLDIFNILSLKLFNSKGKKFLGLGNDNINYTIFRLSLTLDTWDKNFLKKLVTIVIAVSY